MRVFCVTGGISKGRVRHSSRWLGMGPGHETSDSPRKSLFSKFRLWKVPTTTTMPGMPWGVISNGNELGGKMIK